MVEELAANPALAEATPAERMRFFTARKQDVVAATRMLASYLDWRRATLPLPASEPAFGAGLPEWMVLHGKARDDSRIFHVQGAMYDKDLGTPKQYANATAKLFDESLSRDSMEKVTMLVDVRGDDAWKNPRGSAFVPVIRELSSLLGNNFPERLKRLILYPMPASGMAVWKFVQPFLDPNTASKVVMVTGPTKRGSPCPVELGEYVSYHEIRPDRRHRHMELLGAENADPNRRPPS